MTGKKWSSPHTVCGSKSDRFRTTTSASQANCLLESRFKYTFQEFLLLKRRILITYYSSDYNGNLFGEKFSGWFESLTGDWVALSQHNFLSKQNTIRGAIKFPNLNCIFVKLFVKLHLVQNILISTGNQPLKGRYTVLKPSSGVSQRMTYAGLIDCHTFLRGFSMIFSLSLSQ